MPHHRQALFVGSKLKMTALKISNNARLVSLISFILGTGLFGLYYYTDLSSLLFLGLTFIFVAGLVNLTFLILVLRQLFNNVDDNFLETT